MSRSRENWFFIGSMALCALLAARPSYVIAGPGVDAAVDLAGLAIVLMGLAIRIISRDWKISHSNGGLVTDGPYKICRNPMYLGSLLTGLGLCIVFGSLTFTVLYLAGFLVVHMRIVRREEKHLVTLHGPQYASYLEATPAWFPSPSGLARLLAGFWPERKSLPGAIFRERHAVAGNLLAACLLEAAGDSLISGWKPACSEAAVWLSATILIVVLWLISGRLLKPAGDRTA